ncbi:MAG TPA: protein kinase [Pyrinomonadaceae bacterium]|nr:protein kinase [Pyrinomonadaceae bacterium]
MTRRTGDPLPDTHGLRIKKDEAVDDRDTRIFPANESTAQTVEISDSGLKKHIVGSKSPVEMLGRVGGYHIIRKIGEGGMGIVYEAEQQQPRRLVALKVMRGGLYANEYHVRMFEREIQALGHLKHPGIVSIYEAGRLEDGQVFFAMELLQGRSLVDFIEEREAGPGLFVNDKLELFSRICEIVGYAHQRGVIHRDLKPQNIFIADEDDGNKLGSSSINRLTVKILDFGLARITDPDFGEATDISQIGHIKGTLNYMSPEQLSGNPADVDVRSDVYALGVMLYEVLAGRLPYDIRQVAVPEAMRIIGQQSPERLGRSGARSTADGRKTISRIDADVETIVLKALEKEPARRYQSVAAMMEDIKRYLADQPILARPPSAFYQFRKLVLRHKTASASLAGLFLMLLAFGIVMAAQNARIISERNNAWLAQQVADEAREREQKQRLIAEQNLSRAEEQQRIAESERTEAEKARRSEQEQRLMAETNLRRAQQEKNRAEQQTAFARKQEGIAQEQKNLAEKRQVETEAQKAQVIEQSKENQELLYVSQMNLAGQAWEQGNIPRMEELLANHIPKPGQEDRRGFEWYYLWQFCNRDVRSFRQSRVRTAAFSPDGRILAVDVLTGIDIFDIATERKVDSIPGHWLLSFAPNGKLITARHGRGSPLELMDLATKVVEPTGISPSDNLPFYLTVVSPDGRFAARINDKKITELVEAATGRIITSIKRDFFPTNDRTTVFSADSKILATSNLDGISLSDVESGTEIGSFATSEMAFGLAFSPDGKLFAAKQGDLKVKLWELATKKPIGVFSKELEAPFRRHGRYLDFSPDGRILAVPSGTGLILWDVAGMRHIASIKGHEEYVRFLSFSPNGEKLVTIGNFGSMRLWRLPVEFAALENKFEEAIDMKDSVAANLSKDGSRIVTTSSDGLFSLRDSSSLLKLASVGDAQLYKDTILFAPTFSPDGKLLAGIRINAYALPARVSFRGGSDALELWDVETGKKIATVAGEVDKFVFSPDGRNIATIGKQGLQLWDVRSRSQLKTLSLETSFRNFLAFSPDGNTLAAGIVDKVKLINIVTDEESYVEGFDDVLGLEFSADGKLLAIADGREVKLWDATSLRVVGTLKGHTEQISSISFSSDGRRIVTTSMDELVKIWDTRRQQLLLNLRPKRAYSAFFSNDGKTLITSGLSDVQVWNLPDGRVSRPQR